MYPPLLLIHIGAGIAAVLAGFIALFARKGARLHRQSGNFFVGAMILMAGGGAYYALLRSQRLNILAGLFTIYLVTTAWMTVKRKANEIGLIEFVLFVLGLAVATTAVVFGIETTHAAVRPAYFIFGFVGFLAVGGDVRMFLRRGIFGAQRLARHLWRMCVALFIATASFFIGTAGDPVFRKSGLRATLFTDAVRKTHLPTVPVLLVVVMMFFWLWRVLFSRRYRNVEGAS